MPTLLWTPVQASGHLHHLHHANCIPVHAGQEFSRVGLANCAINTSQPAGTLISISFLVFDKGIPVLNATAQRNLVIGSPCATGDVNMMKINNIMLT